MHKTCQRLALVLALAVGVAVVRPASVRAAMTQIDGDAYYDTAGAVCGPPPAGYANFTSDPPLVLRGSLVGCWYTKAETARQTTSGVYLETGEEVFVGTLDGGSVGTFATTYQFESKWDPNVTTGIEIRGRCQHVLGSGTGGFAGISGLLFFKDDAPQYFYRAHITLG
jgi:hypothetical protein